MKQEDKRVKVEFEYLDVNDKDILKIDNKFFRIVIKDVEGYHQALTRRVFLKRVNSLESLEMKND